MKKVVIDANILFRILRNKGSFYSGFVFDEKITLISPYNLVIEVFEHKERILNNIQLTADELMEYYNIFLQRIELISEQHIATRSFYLAQQICGEVDIDDMAYLAVAIELNAEFWTNDKPIINAINKKGGIKLFNPLDEL